LAAAFTIALAQLFARAEAQIKLWDKQRALVELARLAGLYPADRAEISGPNGGQIATTHKIDIETLSIDERQKLRSVLLALKRIEVFGAVLAQARQRPTSGNDAH
jgi:hypothetical protein